MSSIPEPTVISEENTFSLKKIDDDSSDFVISDYETSNDSKLTIKKDENTSDENTSSGAYNDLDNRDVADLSIKMINLLNHLQKIIKEDNQRFEIFEKKRGSTTDSLNNLSSIIEDYETNIAPEELEIVTDKLKQNIINKFQLYYSNLRDMDLRILQLENEKINFEELIKSKNAQIKKLEKSKIESLDLRDKYKSLVVESSSRRNQIELTNLKEESEYFEKDLKVMMNEKKVLKREYQQLKHNYDDLKNDNSDIQTKFEIKNKKLMKQLEDLKNENAKHENIISDKDEKIQKLKKELKAKENMFTMPIEQSQNQSTDKDEIRRLNEEINSLRDQFIFPIYKISEKQHSDENSEKMKMKQVQEFEENEKRLDILQQKYNTVEENNKELNAQIQNLSSELESSRVKLKKNEESMGVMRGKIKDLNSRYQELDDVMLIKHQLAAKELECEKLVNENTELEDNVEKTKMDFELMKKKSRALEMEIHNLKLMMSKNKNIEK